MTPRNRLEAEIIDRLARLSVEDMQRVAEDYARIRYPQRFPRFDFRALSPEGKSRKGWPDAWVCLNDRKDGVEATGDKSKPSVEKHLREDLDKAIAHDPPLSGLIIVSGCPTVHLKDYEIADWRRRFITDACIPADRLELVFGPGLVADLAHPEFARTRVEVLGIDDAPTYFKPVRARMGPDEGRLSDFIPSAEDYEKRRVYRPAAADEILAHLHQEGRALIRGIGASGKTVLAWLLGLEAAEQRRPAYYLDLARYPDSGDDLGNALIADLNRFAHPDTLFILDNCHLDEPLAKEVVLGWEEIYQDQRPRLLLVGRELRTSSGSAIDGLSIPTVPLRARQPEVRGVYRRLAERHLHGAEPTEPPPEVLDDWVQSFGGNPSSPDTTTDLIAFSAAVLRRMQRLLDSEWTLTARDAADQVRETYLEKLSEGERQNLIRLCACQQIELALDDETLVDAGSGFSDCNRKFGLVFSDQAGAFGEYRRYRLAHAALGDLILTAANARAEVVAARLAAAAKFPHFGNAMLGRLLVLGLNDEAKQLGTRIIVDPSVLTMLGPLQYVYYFCVRASNFGIGLSANIGCLLASTANRDRLTERALQTPLGDLANFLGYAARTKELKPVFVALVEELAKPEKHRYLAAAMERQPLEAAVSILRSDVADDLWAAVVADIDTERWEESRHIESAPKLDAFVAFQRVATQLGRPELSAAPALRLIRSSTPENWHQSTIGLHHLSHVLRCAHSASPTEIEIFLDRVATPDWVDGLLHSAPAGGLAGTILSFATTLEPDRRRWSQREALRQRISYEVGRISRYSPEFRAQALSLLGSAAALGVTVPTTQTEWPDTGAIAEILELRAPDPDRTSIGPLQVQLWLGLREMARLRVDPVTVSPRLASRILDLWVATEEGEAGDELAPHVRNLNALMIHWLRRCKVAGWRLVPPEQGSYSEGEEPGK